MISGWRDCEESSLLPFGGIQNAVIKEVGVRIVAVDFEDFRDESVSRSPFHLHDDVERIRNVCLDRAVW